MRILLAEDTALLRAGIAGLLESAGHEVVAVSDAEHLVNHYNPETVDLVITDVRMPPTMTDEGLQAAHYLRSTQPEPVPVVVLSHYVAAAYLDELLVGGGFGYLLKQRVSNVEEFLHALHTVHNGGTSVDPEVVRVLVQSKSTQDRSGIEDLTQREREVLEHMAEGLSNSEIAGKLFLSSGAVSKHVASVFLKLGFQPSDENRRVRAVLTWLRAS